LVYLDEIIVRHPRCFNKEQDVLDPLHYLPLLEQRPGAFEHAVPLRQWRIAWPAVYEQLLQRLQANKPEGRGVREFLSVLKLHKDYPAKLIEKAVCMALELGAVHLDGVQLCLRQLLEPDPVVEPLDLSNYPKLMNIGEQPVDLQKYERLLAVR
jgi:hypothetical protein